MESKLRNTITNKFIRKSIDKTQHNKFKEPNKKVCKVIKKYTEFIRDKNLMKMSSNSRNKIKLPTTNRTVQHSNNNSLFNNKLLITHTANNTNNDILMNFKFDEKEPNPYSIKKANKCNLINRRKSIIAKLIAKDNIQNNLDNSFERLLSALNNKNENEVLLEREYKQIQEEKKDTVEFNDNKFENFRIFNQKRNQDFLNEKIIKLNLPTFPSTFRTLPTRDTVNSKNHREKDSPSYPNSHREIKFKEDAFIVPHIKNNLFSCDASVSQTCHFTQNAKKFTKEEILNSKNFLPENFNDKKYNRIMSNMINPNTLMVGKYNFNKNRESIDSLNSRNFIDKKQKNHQPLEENYCYMIKEFAATGTILEIPKGKDNFILYCKNSNSDVHDQNESIMSQSFIEDTYVFQEYLTSKYNHDHKVEMVQGRVREIIKNFNM
jgi:hypothetical protein